jgi:hypothetical protein
VCSPPALLLVFLDLLCVVVCGDRFTSRAISKAGGRVFDIDVDVVDPYAAQLLEGLNVMSAAETNMETTIEQVSDAIEVNCSGSGQLTDCRLYIYISFLFICHQIQHRLGFLVTAMLHCSGEVEALQRLREEPIDPRLIAPPGIADIDPSSVVRGLVSITSAPRFAMHPLADRHSGDSDVKEKPQEECVASAMFLATVMDPVRYHYYCSRRHSHT